MRCKWNWIRCTLRKSNNSISEQSLRLTSYEKHVEQNTEERMVKLKITSRLSET